MASLLERLKKIGETEMVKLSDTLNNSVMLNNLAETSTSIIALNIAMSGVIDGGMTTGLLLIAGPSKHFKTMYGLIIAAAYMKKHPDAVMIFYDCEFGAATAYFESVGIDPNRVLHCPFSSIEQLRSDIAQKLSNTGEGAIKRGEKAFIFIDSIGNAASKKEITDAENEHGAADMTRAKAIKSLWRITTARLRMLDLPCVAINHTYQSQGMYPVSIVSGGTGNIYSANDIWIIGKSKIQDETGLAGFRFTITIDKSRRVKEKAKIPIDVTFKGGISKYSGLLDLGLELGVITKPVRGRFTRALYNKETGEVIPDRNWLFGDILKDLKGFYEPLLTSSDLPEKIRGKYQLVTGRLIGEDAEEVEDEDIVAGATDEELEKLAEKLASAVEEDKDNIVDSFAAQAEVGVEAEKEEANG